jgi:hypothetical protein
VVEVDYGRVLQASWRFLVLAGVFGILLGIGSNFLAEPLYVVRYSIQIGQINEKPIVAIEDAAIQIQDFGYQAIESLQLQRSDGRSEWTLRVEKEPPRLLRFSISAASPDLAEGLATRLAELVAEDHRKRVDEERRKLEDQTREIQRLQRAFTLRTQEMLKEIQAIQKRIGNISLRQGSPPFDEVSLLLNLLNTEMGVRGMELSLLRASQSLSRPRFDATNIHPIAPRPIVDRGIGVKARAILGGIVGIFLGTFFLIIRAMRHSGKVTS